MLVIAYTDRRIQVYTQKADQVGTNKNHSGADAQFVHAIELEGHEDWVRCLSLMTLSSQSRGDLLLASGSQDNYIRLWRIGANAEVEKTEKASGLDMLDEFERKLAGEAGGSGQISTKAHKLIVNDGTR